MRDFSRAATLFEDRIDSGDWFDASSAEQTLSTLIDLASERERKPLFLLGVPGSGKTRMLHALKDRLAPERIVVHLEEPFFDPDAFLKKLLEAVGERSEEGDAARMKALATERYGACEHLIMIDEAQILSEPSLEFLRILSDTKAFRILLAMHRDEGEEILARPHFRSRSHRVIEIGGLRKDEAHRYIRNRLSQNDLEDVAELFTPKVTAKIHRYSEGNFRMTKRMVQVMSELMHHAVQNGMVRYQKPDGCITQMAAIELGLLDA
jgi:type II secretory pathway predicted ATPase ExeA